MVPAALHRAGGVRRIAKAGASIGVHQVFAMETPPEKRFYFAPAELAGLKLATGA